MRRIVFLDFDGVLSSRDYLYSVGREYANGRKFYQEDHLDPKRVLMVEKFVVETDAEVIVSSSWRCAYSLTEIKDMFHARGALPLLRHFRGITPLRPVFGRDERHHEIRAWLEEQGDPKKFPLRHVVFDDDADADLKDGSFVHVPDGLEPEHIEKAARLLA